MITIQNLKKIYNGNTVLDIEHLGIAHGELIGLVGNNGAGKTASSSTSYRQMKALWRATG